jgi:hypothetical protein
MKNINFNNRTFVLVENSENGKVNSDTLFKYQQKGDLVTANYSGGTIKYGKIIAHLVEDKLHMLYQCLTTENQLKAGKAIAKITFTENNKIKLSLNWEWLDNTIEKGTSEYIEL